MDSNFRNNSGLSLVPDSPAVKRQKTPSGYTSKNNSAHNTDTYNSDADDGDALFENFVPDTPSKFETQPTQIIDRSAPAPHPPSSPPIRRIQVPASSPYSGRSNENEDPNGMSPSVVKSAPTPKRPFASAMAPAGTAFRAPAGVRPQPASVKNSIINLDSDDDGPTYVGSSSDDDRPSKADIKPSSFISSKSGQSSFGSFGGGQEARPNGPSRFQSIMQNSTYNPAAPRAQNSFTGYSNGRSDMLGGLNLQQGYKSPYKQTAPARAMPAKDFGLSSITDDNLMSHISRMRQIFPGHSIQECRDALYNSSGEFDKALMILGNIPVEEEDFKEIPQSSFEPQMKRGLEKGIQSIKDRYSSTQRAQPGPMPAPVTTPQKPKRRLMQGRRNPDPSSPITVSPIKLASSPVATRNTYDDDSDVEQEEESEENPEFDARLLKFFNTCTLEDLIELTSTTKNNAQIMLDARPFKSLAAAERVSVPLKSGKKSSAAPMGERVVQIASEMFQGYDAVDELVEECANLSKPLEKEMASWGFNTFGNRKEGDGLDLVSFESDNDSQRDSGIGSPSSTPSANGDDDKVVAAPRRNKKLNFLKKPKLMGEDVVLKDYQIVGLNWLDMMYRHNLSCILADDMGLGKTCQVISFLAHLVETGRNGPHVVFGPAAVFENWCQEFTKFAPQLVIEPYHGLAAERPALGDSILENRASINVIVSTYDMATKAADNKFFRKLRADVLVCDEGHILKNGATQKNKSLNSIPANFKLLLTGTPLQNNLVELTTLLSFILPDVFKEREEELGYIFKAKATTRDADHGALLSAERIARARSMLTPFVLRRKKHQVLKHLPTKLCRVERCDLHPAQAKIYNEHADAARDRVRNRLDGKKVAIPKTDEQNPIMQLRKAAIHPLLFRRHFTDAKIEKMADILRKKEPEHFPASHKRHHLVEEMRAFSDYALHTWCGLYPCIRSYDIKQNAWMDSGKVEALIKLVKKYKENGDRVLIFSQFSLVLDILESVLNTSYISFTRIDGSTKIDERQALIERFRDEEDITAFLLTTKAGGTGINLMYANKVIIFDGSFNPQDDVQAENRAHRVGQTRDVEVVRLVSKGTIEEAIWKMGRSKLMLDGRVSGEEGEEAGAKAVEKMFLEGVTITDEEAAAHEEGIDEEKMKTKQKVEVKAEEGINEEKMKTEQKFEVNADVDGLPERKKSTLNDAAVKDEAEDELLV